LLAGGAVAKLQGLGGDMVADAYSGLKTALGRLYNFAVDRLIEIHPKDEGTLEAAQHHFPIEAARDPKIEELANALAAALSTVRADSWQAAGVVIEGLDAGGSFQAGDISAGKHGVVIRRIRVDRDVKLGNIKG
jgi:hypothetical protein